MLTLRPAPQEIVPRHTPGFDHGSERLVLVRRGGRALCWKKSYSRHAGRMAGTVHQPGRLELLDGPAGRGRAVTLAEGGRLSPGVVAAHAQRIDAFFGAPVARRVAMGATLVVEDDDPPTVPPSALPELPPLPELPALPVLAPLPPLPKCPLPPLPKCPLPPALARHVVTLDAAAFDRLPSLLARKLAAFTETALGCRVTLRETGESIDGDDLANWLVGVVTTLVWPMVVAEAPPGD